MNNILEGRWLVKTTERYTNSGEWIVEQSEIKLYITFEQSEMSQFSFAGSLKKRSNSGNCSTSTYRYFPAPHNLLYINNAKHLIIELYEKEVYSVESIEGGEGYYLNLINDPDNAPPYLRFMIVTAQP